MTPKEQIIRWALMAVRIGSGAVELSRQRSETAERSDLTATPVPISHLCEPKNHL